MSPINFLPYNRNRITIKTKHRIMAASYSSMDDSSAPIVLFSDCHRILLFVLSSTLTNLKQININVTIISNCLAGTNKNVADDSDPDVEMVSSHEDNSGK